MEPDIVAYSPILHRPKPRWPNGARLALWGRRLVGEALGVVQRLLVQRPALVRLVALGAARSPVEGASVDAPGAPPTKLFGELTAQHTRRMARLGLTA